MGTEWLLSRICREAFYACKSSQKGERSETVIVGYHANLENIAFVMWTRMGRGVKNYMFWLLPQCILNKRDRWICELKIRNLMPLETNFCYIWAWIYAWLCCISWVSSHNKGVHVVCYSCWSLMACRNGADFLLDLRIFCWREREECHCELYDLTNGRRAQDGSLEEVWIDLVIDWVLETIRQFLIWGCLCRKNSSKKLIN